MDDELLKSKREEIRARLSKSEGVRLGTTNDSFKDKIEIKTGYISYPRWMVDISSMDNVYEKQNYIQANYEEIKESMVAVGHIQQTLTPDVLSIPRCRLGMYPLYCSIDIILYTHWSLLRGSDRYFISSEFEVEGALLFLITDYDNYHISVFFYDNSKIDLFLNNDTLKKYNNHPKDSSIRYTINFKRDHLIYNGHQIGFYLYILLNHIFRLNHAEYIHMQIKSEIHNL